MGIQVGFEGVVLATTDHSGALKGYKPLSCREAATVSHQIGTQDPSVQSSDFGFRDEDLVSHSHLPHSGKWLALHPATHTCARSHLQFLSLFPLKFYSSVSRGCPNLKCI